MSAAYFTPRRWAHSATKKLPKHCTLCLISIQRNSVTPVELSLCTACIQALPSIGARCPACGLPYAVQDRARETLQPGPTTPQPLCGRCLKSLPHYDAFLAALPYLAPINRLVTEFKYSAKFDRGRLLAGLLAAQLLDAEAVQQPPDCLLPVPLHWRRQLSRGFNQSALLASYLRSELLSNTRQSWPNSLPVNTRLLRRKSNTSSQTQQKMNARYHNVKDAFVVHSRRSIPAHVAVVDDVVTTGATVNEVSRVLKAAGVQRVSVWAVARTPS